VESRSDLKTAAIIIIGDEILSGKIVDENSPFLIQQLSQNGVQVQWCITIPDRGETIASVVKEYSEKVDWVFTAGGIGPTPDDLTLPSVAKAFDVSLVSYPLLENTIRNFYQDKCTDEHLEMAKLPEGTLLIPSTHPDYPQFVFRNIYIFPGVPKFLKSKFLSIADKFQGVVPAYREIHLIVDEVEIVSILQNTLDRYSKISIGSYPVFKRGKTFVRLVIESFQEEALEEAYQYLKEQLADFL
jgi:molybdenum cofactor synthesis domain-containing protein